MTGFELWLMIGMSIPIILITAFTPFLTRKVEAFGVTVPEGIKRESYIAGHIKRYILLCLGFGLVMLIAMFILLNGTSNETAIGIGYTIILLSYLALSFIFYYMSHSQIKAWKKEQSWYMEQASSQKIVVQTGFHQAKTTISVLWYIPHLMVVIFTMAYSLINYDKFPDQIPMKYELNGEVVRTVAKSYSSVFTLSFVALAMIVVFLVSHYSIAKSKQVIESKDPEGSLQRNIIFRYSWSIFLAITGFLVVIMMVAGQLMPIMNWPIQTFMIITYISLAIILIGAIGLSIVLGQGGSRLKLKGNSQVETTTVADLDQYWKAGVFYWNPNDPAIFVEKRFGVGWSMNYARPMSWIIIIGILVIAIVPTLFAN